MYVAVVLLLMAVCPVASIALDAATANGDVEFIALVGKWFVFWAVGVRLFTAGLRQIVKPGLTSEGILGIKGKESWILVRELGFANVAIGAVAIASLWRPEWRLAGALAGGIFLTLAGVEHVRKRERNGEENLAMISDLAIGLVMAVYLAAEL
jgi:hypothetical protein